MYYVYLLQNEVDRSWYIGYTSNLKKRLLADRSLQGGQTTKRKFGWKLIYFEGYLDKRDGVGREKFLKSGSGRKFLKKQLRNYLGIQ